MKFSDSNLLAVFGDAIVIIDQTRCVIYATGDTQTILGRANNALIGAGWPDLLSACAAPESADSLYWVIEAIFEGYVPAKFLPAGFPFRFGYMSHIAVLPENQVAVRISPSPAHDIEAFIYQGIRPALTSTIGFTDVLLKGIGGPLSDIQVEDLNVIARDSQFALDLIQDLRAQYLLPSVTAPVPIGVRDLLILEPDDLPRRRLHSLRVTLEYLLPDVMTVYSNGAIRWALMYLIRHLSPYLLQQSKIVINTHTNGDILEVGVMYQPGDLAMQVAHRTDPVDLYRRREIKHGDRLLTVVSSLHAQLTSFGCTAWGMPTEHSGISMIIMTVPQWHGPSSRQ